MANKMLIDASHPEETRVVVLRGNRVEEFDFESASKRQLRGNIYLAKVTRVEPSLQAAFVDYGGNRHGFLAFSEIHPDYYQIPVADRQALLEEDARAHRDEDDEELGPSGGAAASGATSRHGLNGAPRRKMKASPSQCQRRRIRDRIRRSSENRAEFERCASETAEASPSRTGGRRNSATRHSMWRDRRCEAVPGEPAAHRPSRDCARRSSGLRGHRGGRAAGEGSASDARMTACRPAEIRHRSNRPRRGRRAADRGKRDVERRGRPSSARRRRTTKTRATTKTKRKKSTSSSSAAMPWKKCPTASIVCAGNIKSRKSSSAARSCWCRSSRKSAATRARRSPPICRSPAAIRC